MLVLILVLLGGGGFAWNVLWFQLIAALVLGPSDSSSAARRAGWYRR
jgi:hypothetical protein